VVICGLQGPIVSQVRSLLTPHPLKELRVKNTYIHHKEIKAAQGIKIAAPNLEHAVAGTQMYVVGKDDDEEELKELVMEDMSDIFDKKEPEGVCVQASTLGSLEALLEFLSSEAVSLLRFCALPLIAENYMDPELLGRENSADLCIPCCHV
jgi:translation initiation factor 5B